MRRETAVRLWFVKGHCLRSDEYVSLTDLDRDSFNTFFYFIKENNTVADQAL